MAQTELPTCEFSRPTVSRSLCGIRHTHIQSPPCQWYCDLDTLQYICETKTIMSIPELRVYGRLGEQLLSLKRSAMRLPRAHRYVWPLLHHVTAERLLNVARVEAELRLGRSSMRAYPYYYFVDVGNLCTLSCPLCPTGNGTLRRTRRLMSMETYRAILDRIRRYAIVVSAYNLGEPFLNPRLLDFIELTQACNVGTNLSSHFNWPASVDAKDIVRSGLEYITASIDGVSAETYREYRVGGDLELALANLAALTAARRELSRSTPFIEWQFMVFRHNEHELPKARDLAMKLGVDHLRFVPPTFPPELTDDPAVRDRWLPSNPLFRTFDPALAGQRGYIRSQRCFYLYRTLTVDPDGSVVPCCFARKPEHTFDNLLAHPLEEVWNNGSYRSARALFSKHAAGRPRVLCDDCSFFRRVPASEP
jgi:radical SAM protein with 4Fe4S-binding SPASM domain